MLTGDGPKVIEFNVRFGDPEAQVVIPAIDEDLAPRLLAAAEGALDARPIRWRPDKHVGVVLASAGYPGAGPTGRPISGLDTAGRLEGVLVFHAGTASADQRIVTAGGRVLTVVGRGPTYETAAARAYDGVDAHRVRWHALPPRHRPEGAGSGARGRMSDVAVLILIGSDSDAPVMQAALDVLREFQISCEMTVASAHRSPERVMRLVGDAPGRGVRVFIVGAGAAAHLAGVIAAHTTLPVIGVPIDSSALKGMDALLSTVQMPPGVPVATVSIGRPGATNAAVLAAQILAVGDPAMAERLKQYKEKLAQKVEAAAARLADAQGR